MLAKPFRVDRVRAVVAEKLAGSLLPSADELDFLPTTFTNPNRDTQIGGLAEVEVWGIAW